ncbi:MAG: transcriptional repressor [Bacteroidia bacterium]
MQQASSILKSHGLKKTGIRVKVIEMLNKMPYAVSQPELENKLSDDADRVTIYRTLKSLEEKGVVHKIIDMAGLSKYALCKDDCNDHQHQDEHLHFHCIECGNIYCLNISSLPQYSLPKGYTVNQMHLSAQGICKACTD